MAPNGPAGWRGTTPSAAKSLTDARLQLHHAIQFGAALGISYLAKQADDSHTNLGWDSALRALVSHGAKGARGAVAVGVRTADLTLLVTRDGDSASAIPLDGLNIAAATDALRTAFANEGLDPARFTLARHYEIPAHAVAAGKAFDSSNRAPFEEMARWFGNASSELGRATRETPGASEVRVWPHHFDIATLVTYGGDASTGAGMSAGDHYYDEPYFYVNARPEPRADQLTASLGGGGTWHTREWIGAVLPGSRVSGDATAQRAQVRAYLDSALAACRELVGR